MKLYILLGVLILTNIIAKADDDVDFGVEIGLSTPNNQINNIYNRDFQPVFKSISSVENDTIIGKMIRDGAGIGYHLGIRVKIPLNDYFKLHGSVGYHRFQQSRLEVKHPETNEVLATIFTFQNIIPITAGVDFYFLSLDVLDFYASSEISYNKFTFTTDVPIVDDNTITIPIEETGAYNSLGMSYGAGIDFNLAVLKLNLDARYHVLNLIDTFKNADKKNYLSVSVGIYF